MVKRGLVLVWDLDQTLIGWSADTRSYSINSKAIDILMFAFKNRGVIRNIIVLTNNSDPEEPVKEIEKKVGHRFDYVIAREDSNRDKKNPLVKDIGTIRRIVGNDVNPEDVWLMDDVKHQIIDEGGNWIKIKPQTDNPFRTGFFKDPDETDYTPLVDAIHNYVIHSAKNGGKRRKTRRAKNRVRRSRRKVRKFDSRIHSL